MANGIIFTIRTGDIRRLDAVIGRRVGAITKYIFGAIRKEIEKTEDDLRDMVSDNVEIRTGALSASIGSTFRETTNTLQARVGFIKAKGRVVPQAATLTGNVKMPIRPQSAEKLAFPIEGLSHPSVFTSGGTGRRTVSEMRRFFKLIFTKKAILGEPLRGRTNRSSRQSSRDGLGGRTSRGTRIVSRTERGRVFLFVRRPSVRVSRRIKMQPLMKRLQRRIKVILKEVRNAPLRKR